MNATLDYWRQRRMEAAKDMAVVRRFYLDVLRDDPENRTPEREARFREMRRLAMRDVKRRGGFWTQYRPNRRGAVLAARECKPSHDAMDHCPSVCGADDAYIEGLHSAWSFYHDLRAIAEEMR